ncbi:hypothetical protein DWB77_07170 [Streptomyces hundungensis]|uniref:Uncharacterized protein n=1 Tax=Streptomyces hundungensis TaxID=1077946 RepID=A0A387HM39_9ACTN|nr:hypothetical protein [Streptomyces hundungensis]AYG84955.1 hypothetical protein DWB77_07170 [Streptomyces hundungensis]
MNDTAATSPTHQPQPTGGSNIARRRRTLTTLGWAVGIPVVGTLAGFLTQYPYGLWVGVIVVLIVVAATAIVVGSSWHRAGVATLACATGLALPLFAGPTLYEVWAKRLGTPADAVVLDTGQEVNGKGTELDVCTVIDTSGTRYELGERQNCHGQFEQGQHVTVFKDPLGLLDPWVQETADRGVGTVSLPISAGLFLVTGASILYAGQRRRP